MRTIKPERPTPTASDAERNRIFYDLRRLIGEIIQEQAVRSTGQGGGVRECKHQ